MSRDFFTILFIVLVGFGIFVAACAYSNYSRMELLKRKIKNAWGKRPDREYDPLEFDAITKYFQRSTREGFVIDDITWNDLDMDMIFMLLNNTWSFVGESYLYDSLRRPKLENKELEARNRLAEYFSKHPAEREKLQVIFAKTGKNGRTSCFEYIYNLAEHDAPSVMKHHLINLGILLAIAFIFINPSLGILTLIAALCVSWGSYYSEKQKINHYIISCTSMLQMLKLASGMNAFKEKELAPYVENLNESLKKFGKLKRNSIFLVLGGDGVGGGLEKVFIDYLNFTFHVDLIQFPTIIKELRKHLDELDVLVENLGELEVCMAIASFRKMMQVQGVSVPKLENSKKAYLKMEQLYHPLIDEPVKNTIQANRGVLLTGSNASGKSTFLKTVALNSLLAQTIYTTLADCYEGSFLRLYSSMALKDNLMGGESYYIVEIKSLKRILDNREGEAPILCFVDEVLRGTNTVERIAASAQILNSLTGDGVICFAATHDIELTHILEKEYDNYHFQEEVLENDIVFNYQLFEGRATSRNAIKLLHIIGYSPEIIEKADESAARFVEDGDWSL